MAVLFGRTIRRLRIEQKLTQQALAVRLGISASYLNLIEHDQRSLTAALLVKLGSILHVDLAALSGNQERQLESGLREVMADPLLGAAEVPEAEIEAMAASAPRAARAVLALYRAWRVSRDDASGITLPSGRRIVLPPEEARDFFQDQANHFPGLESFAEELGRELRPSDLERDVADRLRRRHDVHIRVGPLGSVLRRYDPSAKLLDLSENLPPESRAFQLAFQLMLLEAREAVDGLLSPGPSSPEAAGLIRVGLLNYVTAALLMPYTSFLAAARHLRYDLEALSARFGCSFEQVAHRLCTLQRDGARGIPFFFLRTDPAGNIDKHFSAAGFPFARFGGSCPRWVAHTALATPDRLCVQVAELPDGASFLCVARTVSGPAMRWGEPVPRHVVAIGCDLGHAPDVVYADGLDLERARVGIGLSCRLCDRINCRSRAFPPLEHRLIIDPNEAGMAPWRFAPPRDS